MNTNRRNDLVTEENARALLSPHFPRIHDAIRQGVERWRELDNYAAGRLTPFSRRTRLSAIHDFVTVEARNSFGDVSQVRLITDYRFPCWLVDTQILLRFKSLDRNGLPVNYWTGQQKKLDAQDLPGMGAPATWVTAGYDLSRQCDLRRISILCIYQRDVYWRIDLEGEDLATLFPPTDPNQDDDRPIVRPLGNREPGEAHG